MPKHGYTGTELIQDVHAGAADPEAIAAGRPRLTARELEAILTSASEIHGELWALRFRAPLSGYARRRAREALRPWSLQQKALTVAARW